MDDTNIPVAIKHSCPYWFRRPRDLSAMYTLLLCAAAVITLIVGVLSLVSQSRVREMLQCWLSIHILFGLLLVGFCLLRIFACGQLAVLRAPDIREFSRTLSRTVYVFIYAVIGIRQILSIAGYLLYGEALDFDLAQEAQQGRAVTGFDLHDDFQAFVASGLTALVIVRILMYGVWMRVSDGQSAVILRTRRASIPRQSTK